ncbi:serine/arginine repetitive matrix protein 1 [Orussus abietinus]|uniref:serine/arginine repetitive matrix protein 1 n=1 Tax=Orussus abietinus TaxID=222816 RepID=UPI000626A698|nr:serine/arginine repetitive matrix protein 1 [Orussus abietinus]
MSSMRRPPGPVRQLSLPEPQRRQQVRRQRSADNERPLGMYSNPIRGKHPGKEAERPKVRIAWGEDHHVDGSPVVATTGTASIRTRAPTTKTSKMVGRPNVGEKATILYSRQELAERLRQAWKDREENKSNIDIFLAHDVLEERSESELPTTTTTGIPGSGKGSKEERPPETRIESEENQEIRTQDLGDGATPKERDRSSFGASDDVLESEAKTGDKVELDLGRRDKDKGDETSRTMGGHQGRGTKDLGGKEDKARKKRERFATAEKRVSFREDFTKDEEEDPPKCPPPVSDQTPSPGPYTPTTEPEAQDNDNDPAPATRAGDSGCPEPGEDLANPPKPQEAKKRSCISISCTGEINEWHQTSPTVKPRVPEKDFSEARLKRASYHSNANKAFSAPIVDRSGIKEHPHQQRTLATRTGSAPPQRRSLSSGPCRTLVSITIDAPAISGPLSGPKDTRSPDPKEQVPSAAPVRPAISHRPIKSATLKRRAKTVKRRPSTVHCKTPCEEARDPGGARPNKGTLDPKIADVVTMVSLVSSADSDSDIEHSPRDDKLIHELRNKLPTTPIIKGSPAITTTRKPVKSVSFQQDLPDEEKEDEKKSSIARYTVLCRGTGSALPTPEETTTWRTEVAPLPVPASSPAFGHGVDAEPETPVTDREKRCLVVPIGDVRDKKRKLLRTRSAPARQNTADPATSDRKESSLESDGEAGSASPEAPPPEETSNVKVDGEPTSPTRKAEPEIMAVSIEPQFQTTKEKECWHLYRRMCDKGVYVSFDTVLRGMLTPTEYRLRQKELTQNC